MHYKLMISPSDSIEHEIPSIPHGTTSLGILLWRFDFDADMKKLIHLFSSIPVSVTDLDLNCNWLGSTDPLKELCSLQNASNFYDGKPIILDNNRGKMLAVLFSVLHSHITTIRLINNDLINLSVDSLKLMRGCLSSVTKVFLSSEINLMSKMQIDALSDIFPNSLEFIVIDPRGMEMRNSIEADENTVDVTASDVTSEKIRYLQNKPKKNIQNTILVLALLMKQRELPTDIFHYMLEFFPYNQSIKINFPSQKNQIMLRDVASFERIGDQNKIDPIFTIECCASWALCAMSAMAPFKLLFPPALFLAKPIATTCMTGSLTAGLMYMSYFTSRFSGKFNPHEKKLSDENGIHNVESTLERQSVKMKSS